MGKLGDTEAESGNDDLFMSWEGEMREGVIVGTCEGNIIIMLTGIAEFLGDFSILMLNEAV